MQKEQVYARTLQGTGMTILQRIEHKAREAQEDTTGAIEADLQNKAVAAILHGINSQEWRDYMSLIAETPEQLARLTFQDSTGDDPYMRRNIVYIAAYAVCGAITLTMTPGVVDPIIDQGL